MICASCVVVEMGPNVLRHWWIHRAILRWRCSSPYNRIIRLSEASSNRLIRSWAVTDLALTFILISNGPSCRKLKPRSELFNCIELQVRRSGWRRDRLMGIRLPGSCIEKDSIEEVFFRGKEILQFAELAMNGKQSISIQRTAIALVVVRPHSHTDSLSPFAQPIQSNFDHDRVHRRRIARCYWVDLSYDHQHRRSCRETPEKQSSPGINLEEIIEKLTCFSCRLRIFKTCSSRTGIWRDVLVIIYSFLFNLIAKVC